MNIFILDENQSLSAQAHCDKHVVKMVLETAQIISTNVRLAGFDYGYRITHKNHPSVVWARQTDANFNWLVEFGIWLSKEYTFRYGKIHKSQKIIEQSKEFISKFSHGQLTPFALAMPDKYKINNNAVRSYRDYYIGEKKELLVYTNRNPPQWAFHLSRRK